MSEVTTEIKVIGFKDGVGGFAIIKAPNYIRKFCEEDGSPDLLDSHTTDNEIGDGIGFFEVVVQKTFESYCESKGEYAYWEVQSARPLTDNEIMETTSKLAISLLEDGPEEPR